jgi:DNA polymerase
MVPPNSQIPPGEARATDGAALALAIEAALAWWHEAGVDGDWTDAPQDWLAKPRSAQPAPAAPAARPDIAPIWAGCIANRPAELAAFAPWWLTEPALAPAGARRVPPAGPPAPALMVVVPMPEPDDGEHLLSGAAGRLLDAFLAAAGLGRDQVYCAAALPARIAAPDWPALAQAGLGAVLVHHVALVRPQRLMLFGQNGISTLIGNGSTNKPPHLQSINHGDAIVPILWSYDLETIVARPALKAGLWSRWLDWTPA